MATVCTVCAHPDATIPAGKSKWMWIATANAWYPLGCNCAGMCAVPPTNVGAVNGAITTLDCINCLNDALTTIAEYGGKGDQAAAKS